MNQYQICLANDFIIKLQQCTLYVLVKYDVNMCNTQVFVSLYRVLFSLNTIFIGLKENKLKLCRKTTLKMKLHFTVPFICSSSTDRKIH